MLDATLKAFQRRYITPSSAPTAYRCRRVYIPDDVQYAAAFEELISRLGFSEVWDDSNGGISANEAAFLGAEILMRMDCMIGQILPVATATIPAYMLLCDGSQYQRVDYPALYALLDSAFIVDADNFVVPDLRGRMALGVNDSHVVGSTGGEETHTLTIDEMPAHTHWSNYPLFGVDIESVGVPDPSGLGNPPVTNETSSTGGGAAHNNMPPFIALKYAIVAR